jgi:hypothetical protein
LNFRTNSFTFIFSLILTEKSYLRQAASTFLNDASSKKITARDLVKAGIITNQLASETLNDLKYLQAVDFVLSTQKL